MTHHLKRGDRGIEIPVKYQPTEDYEYDWKSVMADAQELSRNQDIALDTLSLCKSLPLHASLCLVSNTTNSGWSTTCRVALEAQTEGSAPSRTGSLYFHQNHHSDNSRAFWGFYSTSADPESESSQRDVVEQGWTVNYSMCVVCRVQHGDIPLIALCFRSFETYNMSGDWSRRYEELVGQQGLAGLGNNPQAHIVEMN